MSENKAVTSLKEEKAAEIEALPALSTFLPYAYENGYKLSNVAICCAGCKKELLAEQIKAKVSIFAHSLSIEAYGVCTSCKLITPSQCRIGDGGEYMAVDGEGNWKKGSITEEKSGWLTRLKGMFSSKGTNHN